MSAPETDLLPQASIEAASALRQLSEAFVARDLDGAQCAEVIRGVNDLLALVTQAPRRTKAEAFAALGGHSRSEHFAATGRWPDPPPDGQDVMFDPLSFVGGRLNPVSAGIRHVRDGDEVVAVGTFSSCYEGPPDRVHGGMIASAFDEVMGAVFRVREVPPAFTGTLSVRYVAAAPIDTELTFRARLTGVDGRKFYVEATGSGPSGTFATAEATFIEMTLET